MLVISGSRNEAAVVDAQEFQSRNRDACHFRSRTLLIFRLWTVRFNLAIEMLVISGSRELLDSFKFRKVSISQSRCLSFQVMSGKLANRTLMFQSRNRDACHFRSTRTTNASLHSHRVSISQSRCLSFQEHLEDFHSERERFQSRNRDACHFRAQPWSASRYA